MSRASHAVRRKLAEGVSPVKTPPVKTIDKSEQQWRAELTAEQYRITREKGTEPPFSAGYWIASSKEPTAAPAVARRCSPRRTSSTPAPAGPAFRGLCPKTTLPPKQISATVCAEAKSSGRLRRPSGPRLPRWPRARRPAILYQFRLAQTGRRGVTRRPKPPRNHTPNKVDTQPEKTRNVAHALSGPRRGV